MSRPVLDENETVPDPPGPGYLVQGKYWALKLSRLQAGSSRYGPCEVCRLRADSTYRVSTQCP